MSFFLPPFHTGQMHATDLILLCHAHVFPSVGHKTQRCHLALVASLTKSFVQSSSIDGHLEYERLWVMPCTFHFLMIDLVVLWGIFKAFGNLFISLT